MMSDPSLFNLLLDDKYALVHGKDHVVQVEEMNSLTPFPTEY